MELDNKSVNLGIIKKPNILITAKFKSTLLETKVTALGVNDYLAQRPSEYKFDEQNRRVISYTSATLKKMLNAKSGGIYNQLKKTAINMRSRTMLKEDIENKSWKAIGLVSYAQFENGVFEIHFEHEADEYIKANKNFSIMQKALMMGYTSIYAYRLYELLNMEAYKINNNRNELEIYYTITELRFSLCCVNTDNADVQSEMVKENADLQKIYDSLPKKDVLYATYDAFKRNVIVVGVNQINEKSDLKVEYEEDKSGLGGKTIGIKFTIRYNKDSEIYINKDVSVIKNNIEREKEIPSNIDDLCDEISDYITGVKLKIKDIKILLEYAEYDTSIVMKAYDIALKTKEIKDFMGWMINCIKKVKDGEWESPISVINGSSELSDAIQEIKESIHKPEVSKGAWESLKLRSDFNDFLGDIDVPIELLELTKTYEECAKLYVDWKLRR